MPRNPLIRRKEKNKITTQIHKSSGILDDFAVRKNINTQEGTIQGVPTDAKDIVNKEYVDASSTSAGGNNTEVQFNDNGNFSGSPFFYFDGDNLFLESRGKFQSWDTNSGTLRQCSIYQNGIDSVINAQNEGGYGILHISLQGGGNLKASNGGVGRFFYPDDNEQALGYATKRWKGGHISSDWHIYADSKKLFVGAADDASIYYDGSDMVINPAEVGSGGVLILNIKSGATQAAAGAAATELWKTASHATLPDNVVMIGV